LFAAPAVYTIAEADEVEGHLGEGEEAAEALRVEAWDLDGDDLAAWGVGTCPEGDVVEIGGADVIEDGGEDLVAVGGGAGGPFFLEGAAMSWDGEGGQGPEVFEELLVARDIGVIGGGAGGIGALEVEWGAGEGRAAGDQAIEGGAGDALVWDRPDGDARRAEGGEFWRAGL
jgi:hypothetical protein